MKQNSLFLNIDVNSLLPTLGEPNVTKENIEYLLFISYWISNANKVAIALKPYVESELITILRGSEYKINKNLSHKLIVLLSNLKLVPKIQIKFTSSTEIIGMIKKSFIKKILYNLKLFYAKELIPVNCSSFDIF